jgi:hypothetical protein
VRQACNFPRASRSNNEAPVRPSAVNFNVAIHFLILWMTRATTRLKLAKRR